MSVFCIFVMLSGGYFLASDFIDASYFLFIIN